MLHPDVRSTASLLARERRPLHEGDPADLARLFCLVLLEKPDATCHAMVQSGDELRCFRRGEMEGYVVDDAALRGVEDQILPASVRGNATEGWTLEFTTVCGWMHDMKELGIETYAISPEFVVTPSPRRILHRRIFRDVPHVMY